MNKNYKVSLILAAAGSGSRAKLDKNKVLYDVGDKTVLETTLSAFYKKHPAKGGVLLYFLCLLR